MRAIKFSDVGTSREPRIRVAARPVDSAPPAAMASTSPQGPGALPPAKPQGT